MTNYPGMGVMIQQLCGPDHSPSEYIGLRISSARLEDEKLHLSFEGGKKIEIWDAGQSCCESRYMRTDDDLGSLVGHQLTGINLKPAPNEPDRYGDHEVCFLEISTDGGAVTLANHNEHNGYYGGFALNISELLG